MKSVLVPVFMLLASCLMSLAWLGHLRYRDSIGFWTALAISWLLVLPEYVLNVAATRYGYGTYTAAPRWRRSIWPSASSASPWYPASSSESP